ncbi:MAG: DUF692 domain-containing protein [Myxococcales bacterium]|nr:DUF692 domain-containing protein [Myxococcales bacterium]
MSVEQLEGVGLGLRWEFLHEVLGAAPGALDAIRFFEVAPENYMRRGGYFPHALATVAERHPVTTHGLTLSLGGADPLDADYLAELRRFLGRFGAGWHSDHLCFSGAGGGVLHDLLPVAFTTSAAKRVAARVREASERLGLPVAVENISYYTTLGGDPRDEPAFIAEVLERADCGLLLDLNNLDVNAENHGFDARAWLSGIPLERVVEIHVAGPERWSDARAELLVDTHGAPVRPPVYELLSRVISRTGPVPVLLERDNNVPPLAELLDEVAAIDRVYRSAIAKWRAVHEGRHAA